MHFNAFSMALRVICLAALVTQIAIAEDQKAPPSEPFAHAISGPVTHAVSVNPSEVPRGSSFEVTVVNAPVDAKVVKVFLDGQALSITAVQGNKDSYLAMIPDPASNCSQQAGSACMADSAMGGSPSSSIPLGRHRVSISFDNRWFASGATVDIVKADQTQPVLSGIQPEQLTDQPGKGSLILVGKNFVLHPAQDNEIIAGGKPVSVAWEGCGEAGKTEANTSAVPARTPGVHGSVDSSTAITLCNLTLPARLQVDIQVRQGNLLSNAITLRVLPWSTSSVILMSFATVLAAVALVVFLASFLRKYPINDTKYGMFRILFLDPETNTYSLSKYQFYLWTSAAIFSYSYFALSRVFIQSGSLPDVPTSLPGIIAIGAGTAIGSQIVTTVRGPKGSGQELPSLGDFVTSGGVAAPERVQMFVWTNLGVLAFCLATLHDPPWHIASMPTLGDGLMYLMGISSAGYLGGKLARKPGPVLSEISVSPGSPDGEGAESSSSGVSSGPGVSGPGVSGPGVSGPGVSGPALDLTQPIAAAEQTGQDVQSAIKAILPAASPTAFAGAQSSLLALRAGIAAARAPGSGLLATLGEQVTAADAGSQLSAAEFGKLLTASPADPTLESVRVLAEQAQHCAAAVQDLASGVTQAAAAGEATVASKAEAEANPDQLALRTIELRGRNLSMNATFEINEQEFPFRMLSSSGGVKAPVMVAPEEDGNQATMARELRLVIDPDALGEADKASYKRWFDSGQKALKMAITNPDGQRSEMSFGLPPGSSQARG